jgi:hypothetical protein
LLVGDGGFVLLEMSRKADYLEALEAAILIKHKCKPTHRETVFVREETEEKEIVWEGYVDAFDLTGHKEAKKCYAWQHTDGKGSIKIFAVLENQFIDSAKRAVQAAIFVDAQPPFRKYSKEMALLNQQIRDSQKILHSAQIKSEDLEASIEAAKTIKENFKRRQNPES